MKTFDLKNFQQEFIRNILPERPMIMVGMGTCGIGNGADALFENFNRNIAGKGLHIHLKKTGCFGFCAEEPIVTVYKPGKPLLLYSKADNKDINGIIDSVLNGNVYKKKILCKIEFWDHITGETNFGKGYDEVPLWNEIPFFSGQKKIVLRNTGIIDPENIKDYIAIGGYNALKKVLTAMKPQEVINEVLESKLRGRGGAGFSTGTKWAIMSRSVSDKKFVICNADEGDPGAYMNRNEIESDPHMLIEGMIIGAFAMGADEGITYVRAEYPLAVKRLKLAIQQANEMGLLGENIMGTDFAFHLHIVEGAGAYVCGEETALIASIEGKAGRPNPRPPYPAGKGLYGKPTNINNVETWCNIPVIIEKGSKWFLETGTEKSPGTKVFSLVGKVKNTGLVELPLGTPLEKLVYQIGGGTGNQKRVKAVQTGGPSGGCIPLEHFGAGIDFESLAKIGAIMGSGGMVVMDQDNCMVDVARYFVEFSASESCGKCTPCREGLSQALEILNRISRGEATLKNLEELQSLSAIINDTAICGLGQNAPNPILTTLKYFRDEYEHHILEKRCNAGVCESLYMALCENSCPMHMNIPGYIELIKEDRIEEAFELTLRDNPLPGTIGRICHFHCQMRCRREMIDEPVSQGEIHRYLADTIYKMGKEEEIYNKLIQEKFSVTGKKIAIVGAGPAGLTAAYYLLRLGHAVTVYDALPEAGGVLRFGIPQYRLPKSILNKEIELIKKLGVKFIFNTRVGKDVKIKQLEKTFDAIYLSVGAWHDMELNIPNEKAQGVFAGTELLKELSQGKRPKVGKKVIVIGAGNVAIDVARSLWRLDKKVIVVYRREKEDMPANKDEITEALAEGIHFKFLSAPEAFLTDKNGCIVGLRIQKMKGGAIDQSGRRKPVATGQTEDIICDSIVVAIGEHVDSGYFKDSGIVVRNDGRIQVNPFTFKTNHPKIFAGGDAVSGPSTAAEAMGLARKAAEMIDLDLMKEKRFALLFKKFDYKNAIPLESKPCPRNVGEHLQVSERKGNFLEVSLGYTGAQAHNEVNRCLRCDVK